MTFSNCSTEHKKYKHLTYENRIQIETYLRDKLPKAEIARRLNISRQTLDNEIKRGAQPHLKILKHGQRLYRHPYSAKLAQEEHQIRRTFSHRKEYFSEAAEVKERLLEILRPKKGRKKISVEVALHQLKAEFTNLPTAATVYSNIHRGALGEKVKKWLLPYRKRKKYEKHDYKRVLGTSIEERPESISQRREFGHWEIDLVIGSHRKGEVLLTMLERTTSFFVVRRCPDKKPESINKQLQEVFRTYGKRHFKSITTDNGLEFSKLNDFKKLPVYYCHPYASYEKGAVERHNRMLREFCPKGIPIENYSYFEIVSAQKQINDYPRKSKNFLSPNELFLEKTTEKLDENMVFGECPTWY
ncbi:IS30 family transposase [Lactovum odontotermitis]